MNYNFKMVLNESFQNTYLQTIINIIKQNVYDYYSGRYGYTDEKIKKEQNRAVKRFLNEFEYFGFGYTIMYDKITDENCISYQKNDKEGIKRVKNIVKNWDIEKSIIILTDNYNIPVNIIKYNSQRTRFIVIRFTVDQLGYCTDETKLTQKDLFSKLETNNFVILSYKDQYDRELAQNRYNNKAGIITPDNYDKIKSDNISRYKEIIAANKAKQLDLTSEYNTIRDLMTNIDIKDEQSISYMIQVLTKYKSVLYYMNSLNHSINNKNSYYQMNDSYYKDVIKYRKEFNDYVNTNKKYIKTETQN